ncbi:GNAT family N-acetyltransferase [uncultured Tateyamaria sp.]|uniref:GNAT family N-acetyltransferase n=1 Tax=uncultured Tateyamaria sp. TaxID=455651 RepID=UPI002635E812|nr:GNAT family N-acetyltransferase [uncultured Tateyamaria sp.]
MQLVTPRIEHLDVYRAALETGWSPRTTRPEAAAEELRAIAKDADAFVASLNDPDARGDDIQLPDGSFVKRLPSFRRWIWDDGFCGSIELRWQDGTNALPPTCLGHIGYAVVPWRRRKGLATFALGAFLTEAQGVGLTAVDLTADPENIASVRVIEKNGGQLVTRRDKLPAHGSGQEVLFRIELPQ